MFRDLILNIANSINSNIDSEGFILNIRNNYYKKENIDSLIDEYEQLINNKIDYIKDYLSLADHYFDENYVQKLYESCESILSSTIDNLCDFSKVKLPVIPRGSDEDAKSYKEELKNNLDELFALGKYGNRETIYNDIMSSKDYG